MSKVIRPVQAAAACSSILPGEGVSLRRALIPVFTFYKTSASIHTQKLDKNLALKTDDTSTTQNNNGNEKKKAPPLAVIFSWLLAKGSHIDKYCNIYLQKGFDVLTVQITPQQMLFPKTGTQVIATNFLDYLVSHKEYEQILVHGFSVGAYVFGEVLLKMKSVDRYSKIRDRFIGLIFDSAADFQSIPKGFPRAVSKNPVVVGLLDIYIQVHLKVLYNIATKHYLKSSQMFHNNFIPCPALFMASKDDIIGHIDLSTVVANQWKKNGIDITMKCWEKSGHVSHMIYHPEEYKAEIDIFLKKIKFNK